MNEPAHNRSIPAEEPTYTDEPQAEDGFASASDGSPENGLETGYRHNDTDRDTGRGKSLPPLNALDLDTLQQAWQNVRTSLATEIGDAAFTGWIEPLRAQPTQRNTIRISAPSRFMRDRVESVYGARLLNLWQKALPQCENVEFVLASQARPPLKSRTAPPRRDLANAIATEDSSRIGTGIGMQNESGEINPYTTPDARFDFSDFVVGQSNQLVFHAAKEIATGSDHNSPLFFHSRVGLGKTHLLHAIGNDFLKNNPQATAGYITAEHFLQEFVRALRADKGTGGGRSIRFKDSLAHLNLLLLDDLQFIAHAPQAQRELAHIVSALIGKGARVVVTADREISSIKGLDERIRSRLMAGMTCPIEPPEAELRKRIVRHKAEQINRALPDSVTALLADNIVQSVRELEGALKRLFAHAEVQRTEISVEMARATLGDLLSVSRPRVTIAEIQKRVATHYGVELSDMASPRRARQIVRPRQVAMLLAKDLTVHSLPEIGRHFGGRDHTTVMYAIRRINELCDEDNRLQQEVKELRRELS